MSAFIITRIQVGDYDSSRPMFDQDRPRAREKANVQRVFRGVEDPSHVFIVLEFQSVDNAHGRSAGLLPQVCSIGSRTSTVPTWSSKRSRRVRSALTAVARLRAASGSGFGRRSEAE
jgi:hypothetical protein